MEDKYDFDKFLEKIRYLSYIEILAAAIDAADLAENDLRLESFKKTAKETGCDEFINNLKGLIFFLHTKINPPSVSDHRFLTYRPIIETLIEKGLMENTVINIFDEVGKRIRS